MKRKKVSTETVVEILFFLFLLVLYLMWARVQPNGAGPDEPMRYQIAYYIYQHGSLPVGDDPAVRNIVWGISYAFSPILDYMIAAVFMKLVSFITTAPFALLMAARFVNILLGLGTVWLALDMGKRLFDRRKAWIFAAFVGLLPGSLFVFTYIVLSCAATTADFYHCNKAHSEYIRDISLKMFDRLSSQHSLSQRDRAVLELACVLHECGHAVSARHHLQSGYDVIRHTDLIGATKGDMLLAATIARYNELEEPDLSDP